VHHRGNSVAESAQVNVGTVFLTGYTFLTTDFHLTDHNGLSSQRTLTYAVDTIFFIYATKRNVELSSNTCISCILNNNKIYQTHKLRHKTALNTEGRKED
jgi:hypothetical protein